MVLKIEDIPLYITVIFSFGIDKTKIFSQITSNGTYSPNGSYYYLNFTEDSYINITDAWIKYYDINLKYIDSVSSNKLLPAGEYLIQGYDDFTIFSFGSRRSTMTNKITEMISNKSWVNARSGAW